MSNGQLQKNLEELGYVGDWPRRLGANEHTLGRFDDLSTLELDHAGVVVEGAVTLEARRAVQALHAHDFAVL